MAYDLAAIQHRGLNAVTNFAVSRYINCSGLANKPDGCQQNPKPNPNPNPVLDVHCFLNLDEEISISSSSGDSNTIGTPRAASSALGLLLQSSKFKEMLERTAEIDESVSLPPEDDSPPQRSFPEDIQTYFGCHDSNGIIEEDGDLIFQQLNPILPSMFECGLDALLKHV